MTRHGSHDETHERVNHHRPLRQRHTPFTSVLAAAWLGVPALGGMFALVATIDDHTGRYGLRLLIIILVLTLAPLVAAVALMVGWKVTRRPVSLVYAHVAATVMAFGLALAIFTAVGFNPVWLVVYAIFSLATAGSWMVYRIDALRADTRDKGERGDSWGEMLKLTTSRPVIAQAEVTDTALTVPVQVGKGETLKQVQDALPQLEEASGAMRGRSRIVGGERGGSATMTLMTGDPFKTWRRWPGLSHPGASIADAVRTSYYDTGADEEYFIGPDPRAGRPRGSSIGRAGITGSGKSGDAAVELAEMLSRRDVVAIYTDISKFLQNAGWAVDMLALVADTPAKASALFRGVRRMSRDRALRLGTHGYRDWTPAAYTDPDLRMPAVYWFIDEADEVLSDLAEWIATKALSTGIYLAPALPRADSKSIPTSTRAAVGQWKAFGAGPGYNVEAVLTDGTLAAANADELCRNWGAKYPGAHLLDGAIGVSAELYPVSARTYQASHEDLRAAVQEAREHFTPATFAATDIAALGSAWQACAPLNARSTTSADAEAKLTPNLLDGDAEEDTDPESQEDEMNDDDTDTDQRIPVRRIEAENPEEAAEDAREYAEVDPRREIPPVRDDQRVEIEPDLPRAATKADAENELDRVIWGMADEGITEFGNQDVLDRCTLWGGPDMSRRLSALADPDDDAEINPPGIKLDRVRRGRYAILFEQMAAAGAGAGAAEGRHDNDE